jgi:acetyl esterase/lipase
MQLPHPVFSPVTIALLFCLGSSTISAQSPDRQTLQKLLERYPAADANKDGKLTIEEARAYRAKLTGKADANIPAAKATTDPAGGGQKEARAAKKAKRAAGTEIKPDHADVSYGPHANNKLDLWLAKSDKPTPLVVFIHGGGFVGGDKSGANPAAVKQCLNAGVSFASINYRFRTEVPINTVLRDSARAIQFLRYKADEYKLDKSRVAAFGGSAGAGTSLWLAFHDDLADPKADDPVLRESTRLMAAASTAGQATYDILKWRDVLGSDEAMRFYPEETWPGFYGLSTLDEVRGERGKALRADVDMLGLISRDDPPVWLAASDRHDGLENKGDTNHTPKHSEAVKKRCDEVGVPCVLKVGDAAAVGGSEQSPVDFLVKHVRPAAN